MGVLTIEGVVEHGEIKLRPSIKLPDNTKVLVIVPEIQIEQQVVHVVSPRLAQSDHAKDFRMEVIEVSSDAGVR